MQILVSAIRLTAALMLLPFTVVIAAWWLFVLPFRLLGALFGGSGAAASTRSSRGSGPRHYMVQSNGRIRSYFITRGS